MSEEIVDQNQIDQTQPVTNESARPAEPTNKDVYWKFLDELEAQFGSFMCDARAGSLNKSAALRARKLSVTLRKSLKEYREVSVAHDKTHGRKTKEEVALSKEIETV